ncbi:MAG: hypothetical protein U0Q04_10365 [Microbacterium sp.]
MLDYLELALDEDLPDRARRHVRHALSSRERLLAIVADILSRRAPPGTRSSPRCIRARSTSQRWCARRRSR